MCPSQWRFSKTIQNPNLNDWGKLCFPSQQHASHVSSLSERNKGNFAVFPRVAQVSTMASARQFAPVTLSKVCKIGKGHLSRLSSLRGAPKTAQERPFQTREWKDCYLWDLTCGKSVTLAAAKGLAIGRLLPEPENKLGLSIPSTGTNLSTRRGSSRTTSQNIHWKTTSTKCWLSTNSYTSWTGSTHSWGGTSIEIPTVEILCITPNACSRQLSSWIVSHRPPRPTWWSAGASTTSHSLSSEKTKVSNKFLTSQTWKRLSLQRF